MSEQVKEPEIVIFTDGACSPNPGFGGWAAILRSITHNQEKVFTGSQRETTNNRMELTACVESLSRLKQRSKVTIHTDSQYISKAFTENWIAGWERRGWRTSANKPVLNEDLWRKLIELVKSHEVIWTWVKGHANDPINDRCDRLAVEARLKLAEANDGQSVDA